MYKQKAFEKLFYNDKIPFGVLIPGLVWRLAHIFTKGSIWIGLFAAFGALVMWHLMFCKQRLSESAADNYPAVSVVIPSLHNSFISQDSTDTVQSIRTGQLMCRGWWQ